MGLLTKPADFTATTLSVSDLNAVKNRVYDEFGTTANGQGNITDVNVATAAAIQASKIADTAVVCGNTVAPGTQTVTRPTLFTGGLTVRAGTGTAEPAVTGVLASSATTYTTASGAEEDAVSYTIPANTLVNTGRGLRVTLFGTCANNANAKDVRVYFDGVSVSNLSVTASAVVPWWGQVLIQRMGSNSQQLTSVYHQNAGTLTQVQRGTDTATETGAIILKVTLDGGAAGDLSLYGWLVEAI